MNKAAQKQADNAAALPTQAFPWQETMGFLMGVLGWAPDKAWAATPREVALALEGRYGQRYSSAMDGAALEAMMQQWPD